MWNEIKSFFVSTRKSSRDEAKGRLHLVLAHDRAGIEGGKLQELRVLYLYQLFAPSRRSRHLAYQPVHVPSSKHRPGGRKKGVRARPNRGRDEFATP